MPSFVLVIGRKCHKIIVISFLGGIFFIERGPRLIYQVEPLYFAHCNACVVVVILLDPIWITAYKLSQVAQVGWRID